MHVRACNTPKEVVGNFTRVTWDQGVVYKNAFIIESSWEPKKQFDEKEKEKRKHAFKDVLPYCLDLLYLIYVQNFMFQLMT